MIVMRSFLQRWAMRLKESRTVLTVGMWSIITLSQVVDLLNPYLGFQGLVAVSLSMVTGGVLFTYWYPEHIMKGEEKERQFKKSNFIDPKTVIYQRIDVAQMSVQAKAISQDWSVEKTEERLQEVTENVIDEFVDGVELDDLRA